MKALKSIFLAIFLSIAAIPALAETVAKTDSAASVSNITKPMFTIAQKLEGFDYTYMSPYMLKMLNSSESNGTFQGFPISKLKMVEMVKSQFHGMKKEVNKVIDRLTKKQGFDVITISGNQKDAEKIKVYDAAGQDRIMVPLSIKQGENKSIELYIDPVDNSDERIQRLLIVKRENYNNTLTVIYLACDLSLNEIQSLVK